MESAEIVMLSTFKMKMIIIDVLRPIVTMNLKYWTFRGSAKIVLITIFLTQPSSTIARMIFQYVELPKRLTLLEDASTAHPERLETVFQPKTPPSSVPITSQIRSR